MRRKKILKLLAVWVTKPIVKLFFYLAGLLGVLALSGALNNDETIFNTFYNILTSDGTLSIFFAGLVSLGIAKFLSRFDYYMEESMKLEDNHHKIIGQYGKHEKESSDATRTNVRLLTVDENAFVNPDGTFMDLYCVKSKHRMDPPGEKPIVDKTEKSLSVKRAQRAALRKWKAHNRKWEKAIQNWDPVKDPFSPDYDKSRDSVAAYLGGRLRLCSINVFTNMGGDTKLQFQDCATEWDLPDFVISHGDELLQAHKNSIKTNSSTVRLNDFSYENNTLTLNTTRSTYYHMLITNRCMDFKFANGLSIRELYEYNSKVLPLPESKLGNQIGINGLVVTADGHVLLEKRSRNKVLWKNKFAQSISLALKTEDLELSFGKTLPPDPAVAGEKLAQVIYKTLNSNFGLETGDFQGFCIEKNFLGIARDLLEGGKPNLYFYIQTKDTAKELKNKLEAKVKATPKTNKKDNVDHKIFTDSKLDSDYYLVPRSAIEIDYNYTLYVTRKYSLRVHRKLSPRCFFLVHWWDYIQEGFARVFKPTLKRECGEALLATLAFFRLCGHRLPFHEQSMEDIHE